MRWRREVLADFLCRLTNARTEGFNGKAPNRRPSRRQIVQRFCWWAIQDLNLKPTD